MPLGRVRAAVWPLLPHHSDLTNPCSGCLEGTIGRSNCSLPVIGDLPKEIHMDWNRLEGNWKQIKGKVKEKWGKLTDDDLDVINGSREQLEGKIQERYGLAKDQIRKDVSDWFSSQTL